MWTYSGRSPALARAPPRPPSIATPPPSHHSPWPLLETRQSMSCQIQKDPSLLFLISVKVSYRELQLMFYYLIIFMNQPNIAVNASLILTQAFFESSYFCSGHPVLRVLLGQGYSSNIRVKIISSSMKTKISSVIVQDTGCL